MSMEFFRQEYWNGLLFPPPGDIPDPGVESKSLVSSALQEDSLPAESSGKPGYDITYMWTFIYKLIFKTEIDSHRKQTYGYQRGKEEERCIWN